MKTDFFNLLQCILQLEMLANHLQLYGHNDDDIVIKSLLKDEDVDLNKYRFVDLTNRILAIHEYDPSISITKTIEVAQSVNTALETRVEIILVTSQEVKKNKQEDFENYGDDCIIKIKLIQLKNDFYSLDRYLYRVKGMYMFEPDGDIHMLECRSLGIVC